MLSLHQASRPLVRASQISSRVRPFSIAVPARREGEIVTPKPRGYLAEKNPLVHRDAANETHFVKSEEAEKFRLVRQKMLEQRRHLDELERHIQDLAKEQAKVRY
ncbi:hypothetical protein BO94DRAFT_587378 [Aspergillus sclerotioniger CBS 115572]|uniref:ATPase inhibitor, mitochondrial n=1 Tax=Aspergillus sclerotioniger CBS 115572 TaxID=1450535 RepID=A0A317W8V2_9EURO|nr:hypothetical protein BO94DRAFT_587378 [Aspergillus sclerotioniger CBS 115572]PWY81672.1 hypothetical protein BO94DRAFT_587378 [Aspergillus sclerotioniger CBS 115572]